MEGRKKFGQVARKFSEAGVQSRCKACSKTSGAAEYRVYKSLIRRLGLRRAARASEGISESRCTFLKLNRIPIYIRPRRGSALNTGYMRRRYNVRITR